LSTAIIARALRAAGGNIAEAAARIKYTRKSLYRRIDHSPKLQAVLQQERMVMVNLAECGLKKILQAEEPDLAAIMFVLKTLGKQYGYVERSELDISAGLRIAGRPADEVVGEMITEILAIAQEE